MVFATEYIRQFIEGLAFTVTATTVEEVDGNTKITTSNTEYITDAHYLRINGKRYTVTAFERDVYFTLKGTGLGFQSGDTLNLAPPTFFHGQLLDVQTEIAQRIGSGNLDRRDIMPMVVMLEPSQPMQIPADPMSNFQMEGPVTLLILNSTNWANTPTEHYRQSINPIGKVILKIKESYRGFFKVFDKVGIDNIVAYPKFVTGNKGTDAKGGELIFGLHLSCVQITLNAVIPEPEPDKNCPCGC